MFNLSLRDTQWTVIINFKTNKLQLHKMCLLLISWSGMGGGGEVVAVCAEQVLLETPTGLCLYTKVTLSEDGRQRGSWPCRTVYHRYDTRYSIKLRRRKYKRVSRGGNVNIYS